MRAFLVMLGGSFALQLSCPTAMSSGRSSSCYASQEITGLTLTQGETVIATAVAGDAANADAPRLFEFAIPSDTAPNQYTVTGTAGTDQVQVQVQVVAGGGVLVVGTDKAKYKPGQDILTRVLCLSTELKPVVTDVTVAVKNPEDLKIFQVVQQTDVYGVAVVSIPVATETAQGDYTITASAAGAVDAEGVVTVEQYVLPKFEVTIDQPQDIVMVQGVETLKVTGVISAIYTYGEPVPGSALLEISGVPKVTPWFGWGGPMMMGGDVETSPTEESGRQLASVQLTMQEGKAEFEVELSSGDINNLASLTLLANVSDPATGTRQSASADLGLSWTEEELAMEVDAEFKIGLPVEAKITITPAGSATLSGPYTVQTQWYQGEYGGNTAGEPITTPLALSDGTVDAAVSISAPDTENTTCCVARVADDATWEQRREQRSCCLARAQIRVMAGDREVGTACVGRGFTVSGQGLAVSKFASPPTATVAADGAVTVQLKVLSTLDWSGTQGHVAVSAGGQPRYAGVVDLTGSVVDGVFTGDVAFSFQPGLLTSAPLRVGISAVKDRVAVADWAEVAVPAAASKTFDTSAAWNTTECRPNDPVGLGVETKAGSKVFLLAVDKAVELLGAQAPSITSGSVMGALLGQDAAPATFTPKMCPVDIEVTAMLAMLHGTAEHGPSSEPCPTTFNNGCPSYGGDRQFDDGMEFEMAPGMAADGGAPPAAEERGDSGTTAIKRVRTFFPETWVHEGVESADGTATVDLRAPDSITSWRVASFATHPEDGFSDGGVSDWLIVKKNMFASLSMPAFVVHQEVPTLTLTIQNLLDEPLTQVLVTCRLDEGFATNWTSPFADADAVAGWGPVGTARVDVPAKGFWTGSIRVQPTQVSAGLRVYLSAQAEASVGEADALQRMLLVKPAGKRVEQSQTQMLQDPSEAITLDLPAGLTTGTPGSPFVRVSLVGDILGNAMSNLESLVQVPTGCGEQTMIGLAPNVYVGDYLKSRGRLGTELQGKIVRNINVGVQRELMYRHPNGGFSAFGTQDDSASTWLTAYVVKVFAEASQFVTIDASLIQAATTFLIAQQTEAGDFKKLGRVIHEDMMGGATDATGLTAFVSLALSTAAASFDLPAAAAAATKAAAWLAQQEGAQVYTKLISIRAQAAAGAMTAEDAATAALALRAGDHWSSALVSTQPSYYHMPSTLDVEATAYGMLIVVPSEQSGEAVPSARWLVSQQNDRGGFASTQDTVVALEALSALATKLAGSSAIACDISHLASGEDWTTAVAVGSITVNDDNFDVVQSADVAAPGGGGKVRVDCSGTGVAVATVAAKWNVDAQDEPEPLQVTARWASEDGGSGLQETMKVRACASPREEVTDETRSLLAGYHILSVGLFSGYSARESTIVAEGFEKLVMRTEQSSGALEVYLDNLPEGGVCVTFVAQRDHMVEMVQPVASAVFDYYEPGRRGEEVLQLAVATDAAGQITTSQAPSTTPPDSAGCHRAIAALLVSMGFLAFL